jgi:hypothetical protein
LTTYARGMSKPHVADSPAVVCHHHERMSPRCTRALVSPQEDRPRRLDAVRWRNSSLPRRYFRPGRYAQGAAEGLRRVELFLRYLARRAGWGPVT